MTFFVGVNVWEDIHQDSQEFIKDYLKQYPEVSICQICHFGAVSF